MAKKRTNVIPIIEDARHPAKYRMLVGMVDVIFSDVAQPDQVYFLDLQWNFLLLRIFKFNMWCVLLLVELAREVSSHAFPWLIFGICSLIWVIAAALTVVVSMKLGNIIHSLNYFRFYGICVSCLLSKYHCVQYSLVSNFSVRILNPFSSPWWNEFYFSLF